MATWLSGVSGSSLPKSGDSGLHVRNQPGNVACVPVDAPAQVVMLTRLWCWVFIKLAPLGTGNVRWPHADNWQPQVGWHTCSDVALPCSPHVGMGKPLLLASQLLTLLQEETSEVRRTSSLQVMHRSSPAKCRFNAFKANMSLEWLPYVKSALVTGMTHFPFARGHSGSSTVLPHAHSPHKASE